MVPYWEDDNLSIHPDDYDEDISECSIIGSCASDKGCKFDKYGMGTIHDENNYESDTSYGSNTSGLDVYYYEMESERKQRKRELRDQKRIKEKQAKE
ncbi:hypothetical protein ACHAPJ_012511 [Fusarium lateritium]